MSTFNLVVKKFVYLETMSKNHVTVNHSKEEIIQQIRPNLAEYTGFYPTTTMVTEKMDHFVKHLTTYGKKIFLNKHLFKILKLDSESYRYYLDPDHFECNIDKLIYSIMGTGFACDIILKKYKIALKQHLDECEGPCKLNIMGYPICKKNNNEISDLNKMFCGFYIFLKAESSVHLKQNLFDMVYDSKQYNNFVDFIAYNVSRNPILRKLVSL